MKGRIIWLFFGLKKDYTVNHGLSQASTILEPFVIEKTADEVRVIRRGELVSVEVIQDYLRAVVMHEISDFTDEVRFTEEGSTRRAINYSDTDTSQKRNSGLPGLPLDFPVSNEDNISILSGFSTAEDPKAMWMRREQLVHIQ